HVGLIRVSKASSFVNFRRVKPKGVLRIGVFGSSITFGDEVDEVGDYSHMLADQIRALGMNAEVINFAVSYNGFFQDYMMWDEIGRQYDLDYIALGPSGFFADRELSFNHDRYLPYFLHSRYVIENDELRRIDVGGNGYAERFRDYYSFIPAWRYLRY